MREPSAISLSKLLSDLTDRHISFSLHPNAVPANTPQLFAMYVELAQDEPIVARVDRSLIAVLGGFLLGLPEDTAMERSGQRPKDAPVWDAMKEILNISSTPLSTHGRVVLRDVYEDALELTIAAQGVLSKPTTVSTYKVAVAGKQGGLFTLFS